MAISLSHNFFSNSSEIPIFVFLGAGVQEFERKGAGFWDFFDVWVPAGPFGIHFQTNSGTAFLKFLQKRAIEKACG